MKTVNWETIVPSLSRQLVEFANEELSARKLYEEAKKYGVSPEVRSLVRPGVNRARELTRKALRRRSLL